MSNLRHHAEWLSLIEISGPFLSLTVLGRVFPQGMATVDKEVRAELRDVYAEWQEHRRDERYHSAWSQWLTERVLRWRPERFLPYRELPDATRQRLAVTVAEQDVTLTPDRVLGRTPDAPRLLFVQVGAGQALEKPLKGARWSASPAARMMTLLHGAGVELGLLTNGEQWMLVRAKTGETTSYVSWYAALWLEEPITLQAFAGLFTLARFFGVPEEEQPEALFAASANEQHEVTMQLGAQVRRAIELLVQAWDSADADSQRRLLRGLSEREIYRAALKVMMRLVFLLTAEEQELLPVEEALYQEQYAVSTLMAQLREQADQQSEAVLEHQHDAWFRLLATFRALHGGVYHHDLWLRPYGGGLLDPADPAFLEGRDDGSGGRLYLRVNNRTILHILESLQLLEVPTPTGKETRRLSFRALDIEQIGHVYEGLLDHQVQRAGELTLGLKGKYEPEIPLSRLEAEAAKGEKSFLAFLETETGRKANALAKELAAAQDGFREQQILAACGGNEALFARVRPVGGLIRSDGYERPMVVAAGSLYVTQGTERRATGTHYTPRSLTTPIVQYTLEPVVYRGVAEGKPREQWQLKHPAELLALKICDMAMGSGAFLVEACRYLSMRLVEAYRDHPDPAIPLGQAENEDEQLALARRLVADRCLYGVDKNPLAVEMAKLSLWLITLRKDAPFTFLDHALKVGDSLIGVNREQLLAFTLHPQEEKELFAPLQSHELARQLEEATDYRRKIAAAPVINPEDLREKAYWHSEAEARLNDLKHPADALIAAYYNELPAKQQEVKRKALFQAWRRGGDMDADLGDLTPFHWFLEFPEVFLEGRGGFDAFVGNPPFIGGQRIRSNLGGDYLNYLKTRWNHTRGSADISVYFFLKGYENLREGGVVGLIATNTIAQGDTREVGLDYLNTMGATIYRAINNLPWPGIAVVVVNIIHIYKGQYGGPYVLDGRILTYPISPLLNDSEITRNPERLAINAGKSFNGSYVLGLGFTLSTEQAEDLKRVRSTNADVLFPYINGEDINSHPAQEPSRWIINFHNWPLKRGTIGSWKKATERERRNYLQTGIVPDDYGEWVASDYPEPLEIVRLLVYPERKVISYSKSAREKWWQYERMRPELYTTIASLKRVIVVVQTSKYLSMVFQPTGFVYSHMTVVIASDSFADFSKLNGSFHEVWVLTYTSTLGTGMRYIPSDCFQTFPFPRPTPAQEAELERIGEAYHEYRRHLMLTRWEGLTATYNRFHNPDETSEDIATLRRLHVEMDNAVAAAYGWGDLALEHGFHGTAQGVRYTISEAARREVLARLLALNHARYAEEVAAGLHDKKMGKGKGARGKAEEAQGRLL